MIRPGTTYLGQESQWTQSVCGLTNANLPQTEKKFNKKRSIKKMHSA